MNSNSEDCEVFFPNFQTKIIKKEKDHQGWVYNLRVNISSKEDAQKWLQEFSENTKTTYRVRNSFADNTAKIVFKKEYRCIHNTRPDTHKVKAPHSKHTGCNAKIIITVKQQNMKRSKDIYLSEYPAEIFLKYTHNHLILVADALRHRTPSDDIIEKFKKLFSKGHSPSSALNIYKSELQEEYEEDYYKIVADGSKCPTRRWCYELYYKMFNKQYGDPSGSEMVASLKLFIEQYNAKCGEQCAIMSEDVENLVVCICSPLMKRVHKYERSSGEIMFIDSSGNMDRHNSRVFLMLCPTVAGGLPVGIIMTYSECENVITKGINLFKTILNTDSFYGNSFPSIIMTDDSAAERAALKTSFPNSTLLLCKFHVLQAIMRYLWDNKHKIHVDDRLPIYKNFNSVLHSPSEDEFHEKVKSFMECDSVKKYPNFVKYFENFVKRSPEWALYYRSNLLTRGNNTNNFCEAGFRIIKDKILNRVKAFSIVQMFDFLTSSLESYYERKISDIINNRSEGVKKSKHFISDEKIENLKCIQIDLNMFEVLSGDNKYFVNYSDELCSCPVGSQGAPCKHQLAVVKQFSLSSSQFIPFADPPAKIILFKILYGKSPENEEWFASLTSSTANKSDVSLVNKTLPSQIPSNNSEVELPQPSCNVNVDEGCQMIQEVSELFKDKFMKNPELYFDAIKKFHELATNAAKTDSALISGLHTFGKYTGAGNPLISKKKNLQGGNRIGVQPTSISRRKRKICGRSLSNSGRPPKRQRLEDHAYPKIKTSTNVSLREKSNYKRTRAPHSLQFCVENNINLGK
ncbi:uncharacterized protein LOC126885128 [Diabrotica virgifera virgifera]|uniref:Uncharacterized protein LOC114345804 n=1 Tax=Diabrotica virgifera virgifera TaxID=50390 RepID=A0A6P7H907_DIAVI|nr:uncharacterized protein LOC126881262 [Diabrotica virgifera virgifera]XP_050507516.1 uncharacterized protein LOC126885128 [Diabrotica virgifera virgifera]